MKEPLFIPEQNCGKIIRFFAFFSGLLILFFTQVHSAHSQSGFDGTARRMNAAFSQPVHYSRDSSISNGATVYTTSYYFKNNLGKNYQILKAVNNKSQNRVWISVLSGDSSLINSYSFSYQDKIGIILADGIDSLMDIDWGKTYTILVSFQDANRNFINIHQLQETLAPDALHYALDSLTCEKMRTHKNMVNDYHIKRLEEYNQFLSEQQHLLQLKQEEEKKAKEKRRQEILINRYTYYQALNVSEYKYASKVIDNILFHVADGFTGQMVSLVDSFSITTDTNGFITNIHSIPGTGAPGNSEEMKKALIDSLTGIKLPKVYKLYDSLYYYTVQQLFHYRVSMVNDVKTNRWKLIGDELLYPKVSYYPAKQTQKDFLDSLKIHKRGWYKFDLYHNEVQGKYLNVIKNIRHTSGEIHYISFTVGLNPIIKGITGDFKQQLLTKSSSLVTLTMAYYNIVGGFISFNIGDFNSLQKQVNGPELKNYYEGLPTIYSLDSIFAVEKTPVLKSKKPIRNLEGKYYIQKPSYVEAGLTVRIYHPFYLRFGVAHISNTPVINKWKDDTESNNGANVYYQYIDTYENNEFFFTSNAPDRLTLGVVGAVFIVKYFQLEAGFNVLFVKPFMQAGINIPF